MPISKRGNTYHLAEVIDGVRYRESLKTGNWKEAKELAQKRISEIKGRAPIRSGAHKNLGNMLIADAVPFYLELRGGQLKKNSVGYIRNQAKPLIKSKALGSLALKKITASDLAAYQSERLSQKRAPKTINGEVSVLKQLLNHARLWYRLSDDYKPIRNDKEPVGCALTDEQLARLLSTASERPEWKYARVAIVLGFCCGLRACEVIGLKWSDIDFQKREIAIKRSKTPAGHRTPSMNSICVDVLMELKEDARALGAAEPSHFVFPWHGKEQKLDPTRQMTSWRSAFRTIRTKAGLPKLRFHDGRHTVVTKLAESQLSDWVIQAQVGHVDATMMKTYSHVRRKALNEAAKALDVRLPEAKRENETLPLVG
jgi:integrase